MKKVFYPLACLAAGALVACGGQKSGSAQADQPNEVALAYSKSLKAPETDSLKLPVDENGYITIFDGKTFDGWRGYGKDKVPAKWTIEDGCIKFNGTGGGEAQDADGGDLIFAHKFKNFELELEWKVAKGSNSGILYLAQEITSKDKDGMMCLNLSIFLHLNIRFWIMPIIRMQNWVRITIVSRLLCMT